jgi:hypothetical protein
MDEKNVVDFVILRIQNELDKYQRTKTVPHDLLEGAYSVDEIKEHYYHRLSPKYKKIADRLIKDYLEDVASGIDSLKSALRKEYAAAIGGLETDKSDFKFPSVLVKYRPGINPVRALFYEVREVTRTYSHDNEYHQWLLGLISDREFNNQLIDALSVDIKRLEKVVSRYYLPLLKDTTSIPLELFHARQLIKDFRHYITTFISIKDWEPG